MSTPPTADATPRGTGRRWRRAVGALARRTPSSVVLLTPALAEPVRVRGMAATVWDLLHDEPTEPALAAAVGEQVGLAAADVIVMVRSVLDDLLRAGAVERR